jgi:hypothetical protein
MSPNAQNDKGIEETSTITGSAKLATKPDAFNSFPPRPTNGRRRNMVGLLHNLYVRWTAGEPVRFCSNALPLFLWTPLNCLVLTPFGAKKGQASKHCSGLVDCRVSLASNSHLVRPCGLSSSQRSHGEAAAATLPNWLLTASGNSIFYCNGSRYMNTDQ